MTDRDAMKQGLTFSGIYTRSYERDTAKARAKMIRDSGFRAVLVDAEHGVAVYVDPAFFKAEAAWKKWEKAPQSIKNIETHILDLERQIDDLRKAKKDLEDLLSGPAPLKVVSRL